MLKECGYMQTRMQKYYEENNDTPLRAQKNENLYENINNIEVEDYKVEANATVIDNNAQNIDVEKIKKILDTKYNKEPKKRSIIVEESSDEPIINMDETREYDINAILEKARNEKVDNYEKERLKKIRDTQFDILNSLDIKDEKEEEKTVIKEENSSELMDLINTINMRELNPKAENMDPLDILTDLKGGDDTVVVKAATEEEESVNETSPIMSLEEAVLAKNEIDQENKEKKEEKENVDLTNTLAFTQSDFDDFNDLKKEVKSSRALIYTVIVIVSLLLIVGLVIFLNKFLNIGLF